jgi:hypothetical protein
MAIFFEPDESAIRNGNITIPHVARHAEPLLSPSIRESVIAFFCKSICRIKRAQAKCGEQAQMWLIALHEW